MAKLRQITEESIDEDLGGARYQADSVPDEVEQTYAEWIRRQLQQIEDALTLVIDALLFVWARVQDHGPDHDKPGGTNQIPTMPYMVAPYTPNQGVLRGAMAQDEGWLMHANQDTDERAAPQGAGPIGYLYSGTAPTDSATAKTVLSGNRWTFSVPASISGYRIYTIAGFRYSIYARRDPDTTNELQELPGFTAANTGWVVFGLATRIYPPGAVLELMQLVNEPDETPITWVGDWTYKTPNNPAIPGPGEITQANKELDLLSINYLGFGAVDHEMQLRALTVGDVIKGAGMTWVIQVISPEISHIEFAVSPAAQGTDGLQEFTFETVTATPIEYMDDPDYWPPNQHANVTSEGLFGTDTNSPALNNSAYGTDLMAQKVTVSEHWDLMQAP